MATGLGHTIKYKPLNGSRQEIRLLEIRPARRIDDAVICNLAVLPLTRDLEFIAISSLHGDLSKLETIVVNGSCIQITEHLASAIRHVRAVLFPHTAKSSTSSSSTTSREAAPAGRSDKKSPGWLRHLLKHVNSVLPPSSREDQVPLRLWVDSICINQADDREQATYKRDMAHIYGLARMVIGWLGLKDETTDPGLGAIQEIDDLMPRSWGDPGDRELHPENYAPRHEWAKKMAHLWQPGPDGKEPFLCDYWLGADDILNRTYFKRRWILEQVAQAQFPAFLIGDSILSWAQMLRFVRFIDEFKGEDSEVLPLMFRDKLCDMPLESIHALIDEFLRRREQERAADVLRSQKSLGSSTTDSTTPS